MAAASPFVSLPMPFATITSIGAVRAGLLNVLITDEDTAAEMLGILKGEEARADLDARPA